MSAELWQLAVVAAAGAVVVVLWVLFVYLPHRTGEGTRGNLPKKIGGKTTRAVPESSVPRWDIVWPLRRRAPGGRLRDVASATNWEEGTHGRWS